MKNDYLATDSAAMHRVTIADLEQRRPNCTDFLQCPSLRNGVRVPYHGPRIDLTHELADKTAHDKGT